MPSVDESCKDIKVAAVTAADESCKDTKVAAVTSADESCKDTKVAAVTSADESCKDTKVYLWIWFTYYCAERQGAADVSSAVP